MSELVIKSIDQIRMMVIMFQIQYGDKSLFEVLGQGGSDVKIKNLKYSECTTQYNFNLLFVLIEFLNSKSGLRQFWVKVPIIDCEILTNRIQINWNKSGQYRDDYALSLEKFVKLLNLEDNI